MIKDQMTSAQARKVKMKLIAANEQMFKAAESIGVDYYGLVRWGKEEENFWTNQSKLIHIAIDRIKKRYKV